LRQVSRRALQIRGLDVIADLDFAPAQRKFFKQVPMHVALAMAEKHATWSGSGIGNHFCNRGSFAQRRSALRIVMLPAASAMLVQRFGSPLGPHRYVLLVIGVHHQSASSEQLGRRNQQEFIGIIKLQDHV
jgi:hypothetical protein